MKNCVSSWLSQATYHNIRHVIQFLSSFIFFHLIYVPICIHFYTVVRERIQTLCSAYTVTLSCGRAAILFCRGKAIRITHSECVSVAIVTQHAKRMRFVVLSSVACLVLQYTFFPTLSHKWHDIRRKVSECKMCVLSF